MLNRESLFCFLCCCLTISHLFSCLDLSIQTWKHNSPISIGLYDTHTWKSPPCFTVKGVKNLCATPWISKWIFFRACHGILDFLPRKWNTSKELNIPYWWDEMWHIYNAIGKSWAFTITLSSQNPCIYVSDAMRCKDIWLSQTALLIRYESISLRYCTLHQSDDFYYAELYSLTF